MAQASPRSRRLDRWALRYARLALGASFGPKEPLDYSVFSASAAALLLALHPSLDPEAP